MLDTLIQVAAHFDERKVRYRFNEDNQVLLTSFGDVSLTLRPLGDQLLLIEVYDLDTVATSEQQALLLFGWHLPYLSLSR